MNIKEFFPKKNKTKILKLVQFFEFYAKCLHLFQTEDVDTNTLETLTLAWLVRGREKSKEVKKITLLDTINL